MEEKNILQLLKENPNITISISLGELMEANAFLVSETRKSLEQIIQDEAQEKYLSIEKTAELLDVNKTTLWRWNKSGYLKNIEIGGKRRYPLSSINKILKNNIYE